MKKVAVLVFPMIAFNFLGCSTLSSRRVVKSEWVDAKPILQRNCIVCHNGEHPVIMPDFTSRSTLQQFINQGNADSSGLFKVLQMSRNVPTAMPPTKHFLPGKERKVIRAWINSGAPRPDGKAGELRPDPSMPSQISS